MTHEGLKYDRVNIQLRRDRVLSLLAKGYQQQEIARDLGVADSTISVDVQYLRCMSQEDMEHHIQETIPFHYKLVMQGYMDNIRRGNDIIDNPMTDDRTKIQAMIMISNTYERIMNIDMNGPTVAISISKVKSLEQFKQYRQQAESIEAKAAELMKQEEEATEEEEEEDAAEEE